MWSKQGAAKAAKTNKAKYGRDFYAKIGSIGGQNSTKGGFGSSKVGKDGMTGQQRAQHYANLLKDTRTGQPWTKQQRQRYNASIAQRRQLRAGR